MVCEYLNLPSIASSVCGGTISVILWLIGDIDLSVQWLLVFCILDYITGTFSACKDHNWNSNTGSKGIIKKLIMFGMIAMAHGIDVSIGTTYIRQATIIAYMINETGSIIENLDRLGYGNAIPQTLKSAIRSIARKNEKLVKNTDITDKKE